jgi:hypothetical protein
MWKNMFGLGTLLLAPGKTAAADIISRLAVPKSV